MFVNEKEKKKFLDIGYIHKQKYPRRERERKTILITLKSQKVGFFISPTSIYLSICPDQVSIMVAVAGRKEKKIWWKLHAITEKKIKRICPDNKNINNNYQNGDGRNKQEFVCKMTFWDD